MRDINTRMPFVSIHGEPQVVVTPLLHGDRVECKPQIHRSAMKLRSFTSVIFLAIHVLYSHTCHLALHRSPQPYHTVPNAVSDAQVLIHSFTASIPLCSSIALSQSHLDSIRASFPSLVSPSTQAAKSPPSCCAKTSRQSARALAHVHAFTLPTPFPPSTPREILQQTCQ